MKIAILVDGGFYRKRAATVLGLSTAKQRATELYSYCNRHLKDTNYGDEVRHDLYRIFYYDCPPISKQVYHPQLKRTIDFSKSKTKA